MLIVESPPFLRRPPSLGLLLAIGLACVLITPRAALAADGIPSNIRLYQHASDPRYVDIVYDLDGAQTSKYIISGMLSTDGGATFGVAIKSVTGDLAGVAPGKGRRITWNAFQDCPGKDILKAVVRLTALRDITQLNIDNLSTNYSEPYLLDFNFSLRDENSHAISPDPDEIGVQCKESGVAISPSETGFRMIAGDNKQIKCFLVLDYTNSMATLANGDDNGNGISNAIENMQLSAKKFINNLHGDAQVGIYEFHREDRLPNRIASMTTDKTYLCSQIDLIWEKYVEMFPAATRCWDAVYAAINEFNGANASDEQRFIIFLSDGRDESSTRAPQDIIQAANAKGIKIYCIGFGAELDADVLSSITYNTNGAYYGATTAEDLSVRFDQIIDDLGGQFVLRWATLKRTATQFAPSFSLTYSGLTSTYNRAPGYIPLNYAGDVLNGMLRFVGSSVNNEEADVYLRAVYVPRYIRLMKLGVPQNPYPASVKLVPQSEGGLCGNWTLTTSTQAGVLWTVIKSPNTNDVNTAIPFASMGPILKYHFSKLPNLDSLLYNPNDCARVDNTSYTKTGGQQFSLLNFNVTTHTTKVLNLPGGVSMVLVKCPAGSYQMGAPDTERSSLAAERPVHKVTFKKDFYIGKFEVTQAQWRAVMDANPSQYGGDDNPVDSVSWNDIAGAGGFLEKINAHLGLPSDQGSIVRLPSEAEWEYACRAGTATRFYYGDSTSTASDYETDGPTDSPLYPGKRGDYMWFFPNAALLGTQPMGVKKANAWRLFDMSGNVAEWCQDSWHATYSGAPSNGSAWMTSGVDAHVIRGGDVISPAKECRSAFRDSTVASDQRPYLGFRVAFTP